MTNLLKSFRQSLARRKERQRESRLQKARAIKRIRESNLSAERQSRAIESIRRTRFQKFRQRFRKQEKPVSKARFGTEAEER